MACHGKLTMKFRSITYPNAEKDTSKSSVYVKSNKGKLKRMNSIDLEHSQPISQPSNQGLLHLNQRFLQHQMGSHNNSRSFPLHRDLSHEGRIRVQQFQQTHSASSGLYPDQRRLRSADASMARPVSMNSSPQTLSKHIRSVSCLPHSKNRGSPSPKTSTANLERLDDWKTGSSFSPNQSFDRNEKVDNQSSNTSMTISKQRLGRSTDRKLSKFHSTDCQEASSSNKGKSKESSNTGSDSTNSGDCKSRRSQFRKAISLFSLSCDKEVEKGKREKTQQRILRPPTRHVYRRGLSGLPIECTARSVGMVH